MSAQKTSGSRAFFLELVLDLVIFALCAAICLQVFVQAHVESVRSGALSQLGIEAQQIAETFKSGVTDPGALAEATGAQQNGSTLYWYYDKDCKPTFDSPFLSGEHSYFVLVCSIDDSQEVKHAQISLYDNPTDLELFVYEVSQYDSAAGGGGI